ncbi:cohesin subunit SA-3 isoform X4 [Crotalus tigris]|uniref:cohesin subunit SA-3 isoform X4 n=1 Tax=Crotalus tigris TaxID=88082 RepID=UPI00192F64B1|nr:cohesin subunit SA-3 isoform X4 [Crotalus tigris]
MAPPSMALRRRPAPASAAASTASSSSSSSSSAGSAAASGEPGRGAGWDSGSDVEAEAAVGRRAKRPARRRGSPVPKRARPRASEEAGSAGGLFEAVKAGRSALEPLVDEWLEGYRRDRPGGFAELLNFVVRACGCRAGVVTLEMLRGLQNSEIIKSLTESFEEDSAEYPLLLNTPTWRRFRAGFCEFIAVLVHRAQHNVVYDEYLMDSLIAFLTGMSDSQVRAFRHTSTLAAMKLMTALVHVALSVTMQKDNAQRQYETERAKGLGCWAPGKLEGLLEKHKEFQEKQEELETLMNALFKGVFVHRYRDLIPEIRAICIGEMGEWIQHYATSFLTDGYLKYIGWTLHDKQGEVRLRCLLALQGLYGSPETALQMELFTGRFKERIVSMVLDKEPQVAAEAVRLLTLILQNTDGALTDADCERVLPLVYASSRPVAAAAGEFLYKKLLAPKVDARGKSGDRHEATRVFLQWLLVFFIESEFHDHAAYLVDSLWDSASALLKDWQVPTGLLLEESPVEAGLGDLKESSLILILVASMRQATEGHPPIGRFSGKKVFSARERKAQSEERLRLTQHFVPLLPQLLAKFSADAEKVGPLLEALRYFDLTYYSTGRLEKHLDLLLTQLKEVVEKHTGREVLELASQTLQLLCRTEFAFYSRVDLARSCIMDYLADKFQHDATELLQSSFSEQEEVYSMATTLRRIAFFHSAHDLTPWGFFQPCVHLLRHLLNTGEAYEQVVIPAMTCAHFSLLWELSRCSAGAVPDQQLLSLKDKVATFCSLCQSCLVDVEPCVQEQAFVLLSDLLLIFGPQLTDRGHPVLQELVFQPESALQSQLSGFLMDRVFNHSQAPEDDSENGELQVEQLHQRRNLLSGFCKLVVYGVLELSAASDVFKYYSKFYDDYGDIIKETLNQTRQIDRMEWAHTLLLSLQQLLTQLFLEEGPGATDSAAFLEIRDLARRFSLLFGLHQLQNRPALVALHKDGIKFAFEEAASPNPKLGLINLPFLELLSEFSPRLLPPDKALLLAYLKKTGQAHFSESKEEPCWPSLLVYRHSLSPQEQAAPQPRAAASKRGHLNGSSEHSGSTSLASSSRLHTPLLTSTALRAKRPLTGPPLGEESSGSEAEFAQRLHLIEEPENSQEGEVTGSVFLWEKAAIALGLLWPSSAEQLWGRDFKTGKKKQHAFNCSIIKPVEHPKNG